MRANMATVTSRQGELNTFFPSNIVEMKAMHAYSNPL